MAKVEQLVYEIAKPIAENAQCEVIDVEFKKEGPNWFLRVFIDKNDGVTLDDCEAVSRILSDELDRVDPITQGYYLEVSSPGINRPLKKEKEFERFKGYKIEVKLYKPINGNKIIIGILDDYENGIIYVRDEKGSIATINKEDTALVRLMI